MPAKTTFLIDAYNIQGATAGILEGGRTTEAKFYRHPDFDEKNSCAAYVVDVPGFGDDEEARNDVNKLVGFSMVSIQAATAIWVMKAGRTVKSASDGLFAQVGPFLRGVVVTHVDKRIEEIWEEKNQ